MTSLNRSLLGAGALLVGVGAGLITGAGTAGAAPTDGSDPGPAARTGPLPVRAPEAV